MSLLIVDYCGRTLRLASSQVALEHALLGVSSQGVVPSLKPAKFLLLLDRSLSPGVMPESQHLPDFSAPNCGALALHLMSAQENPSSTTQGRSELYTTFYSKQHYGVGNNPNPSLWCLTSSM